MNKFSDDFYREARRICVFTSLAPAPHREPDRQRGGRCAQSRGQMRHRSREAEWPTAKSLPGGKAVAWESGRESYSGFVYIRALVRELLISISSMKVKIKHGNVV